MGKHEKPAPKPIPLVPPPRPKGGKHEGKDNDQKGGSK